MKTTINSQQYLS